MPTSSKLIRSARDQKIARHGRQTCCTSEKFCSLPKLGASEMSGIADNYICGTKGNEGRLKLRLSTPGSAVTEKTSIAEDWRLITPRFCVNILRQ